jgi:hypothetical protein
MPELRLGAKTDLRTAANDAHAVSLFVDQHVGGDLQALRHPQAKHLGGCEVDDHSNFVGCSTGRSAGFVPLRIFGM